MSVSRFGSFIPAAVSMAALSAGAQSSYRNLDGGRPVRVEDAIVTERYALEADLFNLRYDQLSGQRNRLLWEPELSYGALPRTEVWLRLPVFYRERTSIPRGGVAGVGAGAMYQLNLESQFLPATALSTEFFKPLGPNAMPMSYSLRALMTRSFSPGRVHLNASIASYAITPRPALIISCPPGTTPGSSCGGQPLPPLDGPCSIAADLTVSFQCSASIAEPAATQAGVGETETHSHWLLGLAYDKALALSSTLIVADLFAEKFEGIGRKTDMTAEIGLRHQLKPQLVVSGALGRHFRGAGFSTFITLGVTLDRALQP